MGPYAVAVVGVAYLAIHAALLFALGDSAAARSDLPTRALAERAFGPAGESNVSGALLLSMTGAAAESLLVRPRLLFALARDRLGPRLLATTDAHGSPRAATLVHASLVLALTASGGFEKLLALLVVSQTASLFVEVVTF